jgi:glutathione S-transferase
MNVAGRKRRTVDASTATVKRQAMTFKLYLHPFSSYCQKVLIALYERGVPFEPVTIDFSDPEQKAALEALWPLGKFPVLRDEAASVTVPEASLIVEYLDRAHPGPPPLVPSEPAAALPVRLWDRFFDNEVHTPMQAIVADAMRPEGAHDAYGVERLKAKLAKAWAILDRHLAETEGDWAAGSEFSLADCAGAPALFYAAMLVPFDDKPALAAYYECLRARPSFARAVDEARPYRAWFPPGWREGWD